MVVSDIKVDVCIYAFDILYLNGRPLIQEQLNVRREVRFLKLYSSFDDFKQFSINSFFYVIHNSFKDSF